MGTLRATVFSNTKPQERRKIVVSEPIQHDQEPEGNRVRAGRSTLIGRGQSTYTPTEMVVAKAAGCYLWTADGRRLTDFTSGVLVANLGHAHKGFERACANYAGQLPRTTYNMLTALEVKTAKRLLKTMKLPTAQKVLWAASGSEGIQKAMWAALHRYPDRPVMVGTRGGFHGKKGLADAVSGDTSDHPDVRFVSFPMEDVRARSYYQAELDDLAERERGRIALLITEPYLGARGSYHPPKWYHQLLEQWCRQHDIVFIFDEVQSCHGRTGNMFAYQSYEVAPDLVVMGKGLANGEPAAAVVGRSDLIDALTYGEASDTFSGNSRALAAICATLDVFKEEKVVKNCRAMAKRMRRHLEALVEEFSFLRAVRGEGLVYGLEASTDAVANQLVLEAYRGTGKKGVHFLGPLAGKVLRVSPPLVITEGEIDDAFAILHKAWGRIDQGQPANVQSLSA
jgi:4-aminobutyrate aminotransferase-like enzyme